MGHYCGVLKSTCMVVMSQSKEIRAIQLSIPLGPISWAKGTDTVCGYPVRWIVVALVTSVIKP